MLATKENVLSDLEKRQINDYLSEKGLPIDFGVTFSDITLTEHFSNIRSRSEITDFKTKLSDDFELGIPLISANMECVTGYDLAVNLQREGGLAFLPQSLTIDQRLYIIDKIKRTDSALIENPLTVYPEQTLQEAKEVMDEYNVHSLIVINKRKELVGILSKRDWKYETNPFVKVRDLMTKDKLITGKKGMPLAKAADLLRKSKLEKIPLLDEKKKLSGLITAHGLFYKQHYPSALRDEKWAISRGRHNWRGQNLH
jgi:IMP dehydrogenase